MDPKFRKTLLAGAIAALLAAPAFATSDTTKPDAQVPTKTEAGQVGQPQSTTEQTTGPAADQDGSQGAVANPQEGSQGAVANPQQADQDGSQGAVANLQQIDNLIYSWSAEALRGMEIVGQSGDEIGTVENVLLAPDRRSVHVVITMGGLVGIGSREVLVSLDEIRAVDDKLRMSATEEQIEALPDYPPEPYTELKGDSPLIGSLVERSALERGHGALESTPGSTIAGTSQGPADQAPETDQQANASPEATTRTGSASPPAPGTDDPSSSQSATSPSAVDVVQTKDATRSTEAQEMEARERSTTERPEAAASAATQMPRSPLYGRSADNLNGAKVVDRARNEVGTVEKVVLTPDHKSAFVVIDLDGGFLGIGSRSIVVSLEELEAVDDGLMMSVTHEAVDAHREYSPKQYVELSGNWPISEAIVDFAAFETDKGK